MFTRKLRVLLNIHERLLYSRLHSASGVLKHNLKKQSQYYLKSINNPNSITKNRQCNNFISRHSSNFSKSREKHNIIDDNNEESDGDDGNPFSQEIKTMENLHAYDILKQNEKLKSIILPEIIPDREITDEEFNKILEKNYEDTVSMEVLKDFEILSFYKKLNCDKAGLIIDGKYSKILNALEKHGPDFSNDELKDVFRYLEMWFPIAARKTLWKTALNKLVTVLDDECYDRREDFTIQELLTFCDLYFRIKHPTRGFVKKALKTVGNHIKTQKPEVYLLYMFLINVSRRPYSNMYEMEFALESIVHEFSGNELGIIAMSFFKTKTPLRNPNLMSKIINQSIKDVNITTNITITALFKILRYSLDLKLLDEFRNLLHAFRPRIKTMSVPALVHLGHATATVLVKEEDIIRDVAESFQEKISTSRLKDLERMMYSLTIFKYPKKSPIYDAIVEELKSRDSEMNRYPNVFSTVLMYLSKVGIYPLDLIKKVMNPEFIREKFNNNAYRVGVPYLVLECGLRIEVPEYDGPFLEPRIIKYLYKRFSADIINPESSTEPVWASSRLLFEVVNYLREIIGSSNLLTIQILPHVSRADIVLCLDQDNKYVSPKPYFKDHDSIGVIKYPPTLPEGYKWLVICLANHNLIFRGTSETSGTFDSKIRQLRKLGYNTMPMISPEFTSIKTIDGRKKYLRSLLFPNDFESRMQINL